MLNLTLKLSAQVNGLVCVVITTMLEGGADARLLSGIGKALKNCPLEIIELMTSKGANIKESTAGPVLAVPVLTLLSNDDESFPDEEDVDQLGLGDSDMVMEYRETSSKRSSLWGLLPLIGSMFRR